MSKMIDLARRVIGRLMPVPPPIPDSIREEAYREFQRRPQPDSPEAAARLLSDIEYEITREELQW